MKYRSTSIKSKWEKNSWLLKHSDLRKYVPRTMLFNRDNLITMLSSYSTVYFKPTGGSGGFNIIRIKRKEKNYQIQYNTVKSTYSTIDSLYDKLYRFSNKKSFLLQHGIDLARTKGKPFDIRVMVQKMNKGTWVSSAIFMKIGKTGRVATNYNQGGKIGYFHQTMSGAGYSTAEIELMETRLKGLGVSVGKNFDQHKKGFKELGLDVALDSKGKPWILEVNTRPQFYPLKNMKDKTTYKRIVSYAKQYGRFK
ncbi:YheC/YheD family protein [Paenibacillus anaericanus]|uniref:YheC/YheD family protein n=1 Tax=Paenibacillus anaericanus TaxID=170367 RepID=UPI0027D8FDD9|nr:YheC/YheD family protein [Paenibacillus anaericanus]